MNKSGVWIGKGMEEIAKQEPEMVAWYVMRVGYQRELAVRDALARMQVEAFVPMRRVRRRNPQGRYVRVEEVVMHNYLFVRASREQLDEIKRFRLPQLRYVMHVQDDERKPMVVPQEAMENFMAVARHLEEPILYLDVEDRELVQGDRVRILEGPFRGVEGVLIRLKRGRASRVVVKLEGLLALATAEITASQVEKLN